MAPSVATTDLAISEEPFLPSPEPFHALAGVSVQTSGAVAWRYFARFSVVPDSSERKNTLMSVAGSVTPEFVAAIAGSFHLVIAPL